MHARNNKNSNSNNPKANANKSNLPINAKDIIIVGDGPAALVLAIRLKQKGLDVTLIGPRLGEYTRSGDYVENVFSDISEAIKPLAITTTENRHIKDIEKQLHQHAEALGIRFIKSKFTKFSTNHHLILSDGTSIHADVVFDCTGTKREVINDFNQRCDGGVRFSINPSMTLEHPTYSFIRASMPYDAIDSISSWALFKPHEHIALIKMYPVPYALTMEALHQLGWKDSILPYAYANPLSKNKANIYSQVPENIEKQDIPKFIRILIEFCNYTVNDTYNVPFALMHDSKKFGPQKSNLSKFPIEPNTTTPGFYIGDEQYPMIFHAGDATADMPFISGKSLRLGIKRIMDMTDSFVIEDASIKEFNVSRFDLTFLQNLLLYDKHLQNFKSNLDAKYQQIKEKLNPIQIYQSAYTECQDEESKEIIKSAIKRMQGEDAYHLFLQGNQLLSKFSDDKTGFNTKHFYLLEELNRCIDYFNHAAILTEFMTAEQQKEMHSVIQDMAERCKKVGSHYFSTVKFALASKYYKFALKIYDTFFENDYYEQKLALYSNLIIASAKKNEVNDIIVMFDTMHEKLLPKINTEKNTSILDKIYFNVSSAMICILAKTQDETKYIEQVMQIQKLIGNISSKSSEFAKALQDQLDDIQLTRALDQVSQTQSIKL